MIAIGPLEILVVLAVLFGVPWYLHRRREDRLEEERLDRLSEFRRLTGGMPGELDSTRPRDSAARLPRRGATGSAGDS